MEMIDKSIKSTKTSEPHPRVSIITVTYNAESLLARTLQSVLAQRYADKEIVVVDGQSSDGTVAVINAMLPLSSRGSANPTGASMTR